MIRGRLKPKIFEVHSRFVKNRTTKIERGIKPILENNHSFANVEKVANTR